MGGRERTGSVHCIRLAEGCTDCQGLEYHVGACTVRADPVGHRIRGTSRFDVHMVARRKCFDLAS